MSQGPSGCIPACGGTRFSTKRRAGTTSDVFKRVTNVSLPVGDPLAPLAAPGWEADRLLTAAAAWDAHRAFLHRTASADRAPTARTRPRSVVALSTGASGADSVRSDHQDASSALGGRGQAALDTDAAKGAAR